MDFNVLHPHSLSLDETERQKQTDKQTHRVKDTETAVSKEEHHNELHFFSVRFYKAIRTEVLIL